MQEYPLCLLHQGMQNRRILDAIMASEGASATPRAMADGYLALLAMVRSGGMATVVPEGIMALIEGAHWAHVRPLAMRQAVSRIGVIVANRVPLDPIANAALACAQQLARHSDLD